jgi:hypothetical protein
MADYLSKSKSELISLCKVHKIKGYSGKNKSELINLLSTPSEVKSEKINNLKLSNKKNKGQFYTTNCSYILDGLSIPTNIEHIIEPFAGKGDLLDWLKESNTKAKIEAYDIEPKRDDIIQKDTLNNPPNYKDTWIITNPPYLARNKSDNKELFDKYNTNDLYKCFISSVVLQNNCKGGIFIIPAGFFLSPRDIDVRCRHNFMSKYKITNVRYFEESVFDDTPTTIVAFSFEKSDKELTEQNVEWILLPFGEKKIFHMSSENDWIIGGDIYNLPIDDSIKIRRHVDGHPLKEDEQQTFMTLNALDSGTKDGRICLEYKKDYIYPAKDTSRTYATLRIIGKTLTDEEQINLCKEFNKFVEEKREKTHSMFLPQFRESKEYARKRIPFELAYRIIQHLIMRMSS